MTLLTTPRKNFRTVDDAGRERALLAQFHLRLNANPELLVCTHAHCLGTGGPLTPSWPSLEAHISIHHDYTPSAFADLKAYLEKRQIANPARIEDQLEPVPQILELPLYREGYSCPICPYAVNSKTPAGDHMRERHPNAHRSAKMIHPAAVQVYMMRGGAKRYFHVKEALIQPRWSSTASTQVVETPQASRQNTGRSPESRTRLEQPQPDTRKRFMLRQEPLKTSQKASADEERRSKHHKDPQSRDKQERRLRKEERRRRRAERHLSGSSKFEHSVELDAFADKVVAVVMQKLNQAASMSLADRELGQPSSLAPSTPRSQPPSRSQNHVSPRIYLS